MRYTVLPRERDAVQQIRHCPARSKRLVRAIERELAIRVHNRRLVWVVKRRFEARHLAAAHSVVGKVHPSHTQIQREARSGLPVILEVSLTLAVMKCSFTLATGL